MLTLLAGGYLAISAAVAGGMFMILSGFPGGVTWRETLAVAAFGLMWPAGLALLCWDLVTGQVERS